MTDASPSARHPALIIALFTGALGLSVLGGVSIGSVGFDAGIVWEVRAPRVLLAATVGAGLAISGTVLQAIVHNALADPYLLGVHSGASTGAAGVILFGSAFITQAGDYALQAAAFLGAMAATALVFSLARDGSSSRLILAGVAVGYALSSATSFLVFASDSAESTRSVMFWLLGSLGLAAWDGPLILTGAVVLCSTALLTLLGPRIDALAAGDDTALSVGINPARLRTGLVILVSLLVGTVVAMSGAIAFIGLVVPHLARGLVGARHRWVVPAAALSGAVLLVWADVLSRMLLAPQELPVGIVTALLGAPFLLILIRKQTL